MTSRDTSEFDRVRGILVSAQTGSVRYRVEGSAEDGRPVALIHVFGAYDCKGTEAELSGLLRDCDLPWRIVWH